jgi:hypothetical protein
MGKGLFLGLLRCDTIPAVNKRLSGQGERSPKRGTSFERASAYAGIAFWGVFILLSIWPFNPIGFVIMILLTIRSVVEFKQWQAGERAKRLWGIGDAKDRMAYPSTAWYSAVAWPTAVLFLAIFALIANSTGRSGSPNLLAVLAVSFVAGSVFEWWMRRAAKERELAREAAKVPMPPAPPGYGPQGTTVVTDLGLVCGSCMTTNRAPATECSYCGRPL